VKYHPSFVTETSDGSTLVEGRIVHHKDRVWLGPSPAQRQEVFDEIFEHLSVSRSLENLGVDHAVLRIGWQDLMSFLAMESSDLDCRRATGRPACAPYTGECVTARFIHKNELKGPVFR
jgi:hypothetical protein